MMAPMRASKSLLDRRTFLKCAAGAAASSRMARVVLAQDTTRQAASLFDGKSLDGWIQVQNSATSFSSSDIIDLLSLGRKITEKPDAEAAFLNEKLDPDVRTDLIAYSPQITDAKPVVSALAKNLTRIIFSENVYDRGRFRNIQLRPETQKLLNQNPRGRDLVHLNRLLLEDAFPSELAKGIATGWTVKDGAMASVGAGRGVIYTAGDYDRYRLMFTMRHVSGNPDHQACALIFCTRPAAEEIPLDALGGIQFQVPNGGHWDYRPGQNNAGGDEFATIRKTQCDPHEWSRVELLVDAAAGTARMAVAQPVGNKAVEVLTFKNAAAGKPGPIAWQMHNAGLFDEYKDVTIEINPRGNDLVTV